MGLGRIWPPVFLALCASTITIATRIQENWEEARDALREGQHNASLTQEMELFLGYEDAHGKGDTTASTHYNVFADLFRRQEGCLMYEAGKTYTCVDSSDLCCNVGGYGWCCANTVGCGTTSGQCTYSVEWTTSTYWRTDYDYYTRTVYRTSYVTSTRYSYTTVTADLDTATVWVTVTSEALRAGRRGAPAEPTATATTQSLPTTIFPSYIPSLPIATLAPVTSHRQELRDPNTTPAPLYIQIRGLLFPRQTTSRTDTSETTVTETTTIESTTSTTSTITDVYWTTSYDTRTAALNAKTTVTSTTTLHLQPGETVPASSADDEEIGGSGGGSGGGGRRKGISSAARAGIGVGVTLVVAGIAALIGFFVKKRKNEKTAAATPFNPPMAQTQPYSPPPQNPPGSPMTTSDQQYSQMTSTPPISYGTPSPGPSYGYQSAPIPVASPPPLQQQQQYAAYQYPRPPSPSYTRPTELAIGAHQQEEQVPSEMPTVYSPHPQRVS